jgi:hypothetical protein
MPGVPEMREAVESSGDIDLRLHVPSAALAVAVHLTVRDQVWVHGVGSSMTPTIRDGDRILLVRAAPNAIRKWHVVGVALDHDVVLHRIVNVLPDSRIQTRGDARLISESPTAAENILGLAVLVERGRHRVALHGDLAYGVVPFVRGRVSLARWHVARWWRGGKETLRRLIHART